MASPAKSASMKSIVGSQDDWIELQKRTYTAWSNAMLKFIHGKNLEIKDLANDLKDGILLSYLIQAASGMKNNIRRNEPTPGKELIKTKAIENINAALKVAEEDGVRLTNIGANDIFEGNEKLIQGLIWTLILHYQIGGAGGGVKKAILEWVNKLLPDANVTDLKKHWSDGKLLAQLLNALLPNAISQDDIDTLEPVPLTQKTMEKARDDLDVPIIIPAEDFVECGDENIRMMVLSYYRNIHDEKTGKASPAARRAKTPVPAPAPVVDTGEIDRLKKLLDEKTKEAETLEEKTKEQTVVIDTTAQDLEKEKEEKKVLQEEKKVLQDDNKALQEEVDRLRQQNSQASESQNATVDELNKKVASTTAENEKLRKQLEATLADHDALATSSQANEDRVNELTKELADKNEMIEKLVERDMASLRNNLKLRTEEAEDLRAKLKSLASDFRNELTELIKQRDASMAELGKLKGKVSAYSKQLVEMQDQVANSSSANIEQLENELQKMRIKNEEMQDSINSLEAEMLEANKKAEELMALLNQMRMDDDDNGAPEAGRDAEAGAAGGPDTPRMEEYKRDERLRDRLSVAEAQIAAMIRFRAEKEAQIADLCRQNEENTELLKLLDRKVKAGMAEREELVNEAEELKKRLAEAQAATKTCETNREDLNEQVSKLDEQVETLKKELEAAKSNLHDSQSHLDSLKNTAAKSQSDLAAAEKKLAQEKEKEKEMRKFELSAKEMELMTANQQAETAKHEAERAQKALEAAQKEVESIKKKLAEKDQQIAEKDELLRESMESLAGASQDTEALNEKNKELAERENVIMKLQEELSKLRAEIAEMKDSDRELEPVLEKLASATRLAQERAEALGAADKNAANARAELDRLKAENEKLKKKRDELDKDLADERASHTSKSGEIELLTKQLQNKEKELEKLKGEFQEALTDVSNKLAAAEAAAKDSQRSYRGDQSSASNVLKYILPLGLVVVALGAGRLLGSRGGASSS